MISSQSSTHRPRVRRKNVKLLAGVTLLLGISLAHAFSQTAYFVDGWHGGVWGHYPPWVTQFLVDQLNKNPDWKINLEIEPETWDYVQAATPDAYKQFKALFADQSSKARIEYINPDFAQSYLWDVTGESVIRQFDYGIRKVRQHFPNANLSVYSSEEPCFTSALPGILKSFGFKYAVLKNPNTCWGGYTRAFGGELVNWVGPDGSTLITVPRYASEPLNMATTWKTMASDNAPAYIKAALAYGIAHPVGMCLQDAGWQHGPRLGSGAWQPSQYVTWRDYFENLSIKSPVQYWRFSQEDVLVSLMWGSQVLQKIAQQVRSAENRIIMAEKLAAMAATLQGTPWPQSSFDSGWRTLLLSEHHDCWITPYNFSRTGDGIHAEPRTFSTKRGSTTWAGRVALWTDNTRQISDTSMAQSVNAMTSGTASERTFIHVFNTAGMERRELAKVPLPVGWNPKYVMVVDDRDREAPSQVIPGSGTNGSDVLFSADTPSMGYNTYRLEQVPETSLKGASISVRADGTYQLNTDLYSVVLDPARGGTIKSLKAKHLGNKEFVDGTNDRRFSEIRGFFFEEGKYHSSADQPARISILENGPLEIRAQVSGVIGIHPFVQTITLAQGRRRIDFNLTIQWQGSPGIGSDYAQGTKWRSTDNKKAFYDDSQKLLALFPLKLKAQQIYKDAAFDVTKSKLSDTFFTTWSGIKNNIILDWVDATDDSNQYGVALLTDHTTSYAHGTNYPLGLTLQYSGIGLWGRSYRVSTPMNANYALIPHAGRWDEAGIWSESDCWDQPLITSVTHSIAGASRKSLVSLSGTGWEISAMTRAGKDLLVRFFNAEGNAAPKRITLDGHADLVELVGLDGHEMGRLPREEKEGKTIVTLSLHRFRVQTVRFANCSAAPQ